MSKSYDMKCNFSKKSWLKCSAEIFVIYEVYLLLNVTDSNPQWWHEITSRSFRATASTRCYDENSGECSHWEID